jgi:hypothetical protein
MPAPEDIAVPVYIQSILARWVIFFTLMWDDVPRDRSLIELIKRLSARSPSYANPYELGRLAVAIVDWLDNGALPIHVRVELMSVLNWIESYDCRN